MNEEFKITNPQDIASDGIWTITQEDLRKIQEQNNALNGEIRGRVISASLNIEHRLDDILSLMFMGTHSASMNLFKELLLEKEFFTFMNKWKLFRELAQRKIINFKEEDVRKKTLDLVKTVIETRDKFAHGDISFSGTIPQLSYLESGEKKKVILNNTYFDDLNVKFTQADNILRDIFEFFLKDKEQSEKSQENQK